MTIYIKNIVRNFEKVRKKRWFKGACTTKVTIGDKCDQHDYESRRAPQSLGRICWRMWSSQCNMVQLLLFFIPSASYHPPGSTHNVSLLPALLVDRTTRAAIHIDCFSIFPREVSLKVFGYLDATSLCRATQVGEWWKNLGDDDVLWRVQRREFYRDQCEMMSLV